MLWSPAAQGPRCQSNQAIVLRAQEDEDEQKQWSDDSDVPEDELADRVTELTNIKTCVGMRAPEARAGSSDCSSNTEASSKNRRRKKVNNINFALPRAGDGMHIAFVVDASLSMATEDVEWIDPSSEIQVVPAPTIRRIDAVMSACRAFLSNQASEAEHDMEDVFSLILFNDKADIIFDRKSRKGADRHLQKLHKKVSPTKDTKFQSAFKCIHRLVKDSDEVEDVRIILLSDGQPYEKGRVMKLFEDVLLKSPFVQLLENFEVHAIGFGIESYHFKNLQAIAEANKGTFQVASFKYLELTKSLTSVAATMTRDARDQSAASKPVLQAAALSIPFDPDPEKLDALKAKNCAPKRFVKRSCSLILHRFTAQWRKFVDDAKVISTAVEVTIDLMPFQYGGMRLVYGMTDDSKLNAGSSMVAKRLIKEPHASKQDMVPFLRCTSFAISTRAAFFSKASSAGLRIPWDIWFVPCYLYMYKQDDEREGFFVGEQRLDTSAGRFTKFNGNNGYVNPRDPPGTELMQAFSHYSFIRSKGTCIVVDLQGVLDGTTFLLTDPQVHSRGKHFGRGDFGFEGFKLFFETHRCGRTCQALRLPGQMDELIKELRLEKQQRRCLVCMDAPSKTVLQPCGHSAVCQACVLRLFEETSPACPLCREGVTRYESGVFSSTYVKPEKRVSFG
eukprot:TRINITY_DN58862_c0_g1_i1.p1 TRINITY_DN58862_c0_g1~~TRINITY_DN58862_c0_g1_i1.p1  ORF type:complete len:699 (+),score=125.04 TRINITY_DN58862_c0_g1_i1:77-2098(+)